MNWTIKIPQIAATTLNGSYFIATINGTDNNIYLNNIDPKDNKNILPLVLLIFRVSVSPMTMKLIILKIVPNTNPLPDGFNPATINSSAMTIAPAIALEQYFFCNCLTSSILRIVAIFLLAFGYFENLSVNGVSATDDTQNYKDRYENPFRLQPSIKVATDKKTK